MLTHTFPFPPPGAIAGFGAEVLADVVELAAGAGLAAVLGLNRFPIAESGLDGDAEAVGLGEAVAFLRERRCLGEAAGEALLLAGAGEAALLADGAGDAGDFLCARLAGEAEGVGLGDEVSACKKETPTKATRVVTSSCLRRIKRRVATAH